MEYKKISNKSKKLLKQMLEVDEKKRIGWNRLI